MPPQHYRTSLWQSFHILQNSIRSSISLILQGLGLTPLQSYTLSLIKTGEATNIGQLCNLLGITQSNASTLCKKLEQAGFILRTRSTLDERVVLLSLTDKGLETIIHVQDSFSVFDDILANYPHEKLDAIENGMTAINELLINFINIWKEKANA